MHKKKRVRAEKTKRKRTVALAKRISRRKAGRGKKTTSGRKAARKKRTAFRKRPVPDWATLEEKRPGPEAGGQSGDVQGLSRVARVDSESVAELAEEGQSFEAGVVNGVESALDAAAAEITTKEVPEDDIPPEYRERE